MLDREKILSTRYRQDFREEIKTYLSNNNFENHPTIKMYYQLFLSLTETEDGTYFLKFSEKLRQGNIVLPHKEMKELYFYAINFCINKIRNGEKQYAGDLMDLYQEGIEQEHLLDEGIISPWTYKNMVKLGLGLKRFDWVESFVLDYSEKLAESQRKDAYHYNLADLFFHKKMYDNALFHLNQVEFTDVHYNIGAKAMLLKIYYETPYKIYQEKD